MNSPTSSVNFKAKTWKGVASFVAILVLAIVGVMLWRRQAGPQPPTVSQEDLEPAVWTAIEKSRDDVYHSPHSATAWGHLGMVLLAHKFPEEARLCFARAEQLVPGEPRWPYYQGMILVLTDNSAAIAKFQRTAQLGGDRCRVRLAEALMEEGLVSEASRQFELLLEENASHPLAHLGLARLAYDRNDWEECFPHVRQAASSPYSRKAAHALLAAVYERQGNTQAAEAELKILSQLPSDSVWPDPLSEELVQLRVDRRARFKKATQLLDENRLPEAEVALQSLVDEFPDMDMGWRTLGYAQYLAGNLVGAEQSLKTACRLNPNSVEAQYYLGCVALARKKYEIAKLFLLRAIELKPDYAQAHYQLALCYSGQEERPQAIEELRTALRCRPYLAEAHRDLGQLLAMTGQIQEAREHLRRAVDLAPTDVKAKQLLEKWTKPGGPSPK
jgi:tetratricopeptide (TPR) repeat protein